MPSYLLFSTCSLIWGATYWAITLQLGEAPPAVSIVYRFALASSALFLWSRLRGSRLSLPWRTQRWVAVQGFFNFCLNYVCTYHAEQHLVSALVAVLYTLMVLWTPLCARVAFGTPIATRVWSAGAGAICGVTLLFSQALGAALQQGRGVLLLGVGVALVGTFSSSAGALVVGKVRERSPDVVLTTAWSMLWGTLMVGAWALASGQRFVLPQSPSYWLALGYLSLFGSVIAFIAYFTLINRIGSQKAVFTSVVTPVISLLLSVGLEGYRPGLLELLGAAVCLASVGWVLGAPAGAKPPQAAATPPVLKAVIEE